jgi:hypothetical protein
MIDEEAERLRHAMEGKQKAELSDVEFMFNAFKKESERKKKFGDDLKHEIDSLLTRKNRTDTQREEYTKNKQEYLPPELMITEAYDSSIVDEALDLEPDELIDKYDGRALTISTDDLECLILVEPRIPGEFREKITEARSRFSSNCFTITKSVGYNKSILENGSILKKTDPVVHCVDNKIMELDDILN